MSYVKRYVWSTLMYAISSIEPHSQFFPPTFIFMKPCGLKIGCLQSKSKMSCYFLFLFLFRRRFDVIKPFLTLKKIKRAKWREVIIALQYLMNIIKAILVQIKIKIFWLKNPSIYFIGIYFRNLWILLVYEISVKGTKLLWN